MTDIQRFFNELERINLNPVMSNNCIYVVVNKELAITIYMNNFARGLGNAIPRKLYWYFDEQGRYKYCSEHYSKDLECPTIFVDVTNSDGEQEVWRQGDKSIWKKKDTYFIQSGLQCFGEFATLTEALKEV